MEDKSLYNSQQSQGISETLQNYIDSMVEEIVLEGKPFDTQKKYLKKFSENEGLDYEAIEKGITELVETMREMKSSGSKMLIKLALIQAKDACVTDATVLSIAQHIGNKVDEDSSAKRNAIAEMIQSLQIHSAKNEKKKPTLDFNVSGVEFSMVKVEGGSFWMGAHKQYRRKGLFSKEPDTSIPNFDLEAWDDECPVHKVTMNSYYIGETEVTQALWKMVMGNNPSYFHGDNFPVENVSWCDCQTFISRLNERTGISFRLPTEAEWEYAARGGQKSNGYIYSGSNVADEVAWCGSNMGDNRTHPVKMKKPNELGLYDMSGNVWEWCADKYEMDYYRKSSLYNPAGPSLSSTYRVLRGGSWCLHKCDSRVSRRSHDHYDVNDSSFGLRLALSL